MNKQPDSVTFLLAESIRQEIDGKHTIVGAYPGDHVVLNGRAADMSLSPETPAVLPGLYLYTLFRGGVGNFKATVHVSDPQGNQIKPPLEFPVEGVEGATITILVNMVPFTIPSLGRYTINVHLDDVAYSYSFLVTQGQIEQ